MPEHIQRLALASKLERVSTYRQLQALSNSLKHLSGGRVILSTFFLPESVITRPVQEHEVRIVRDEEGQSYLARRISCPCRPPTGPSKHRCRLCVPETVANRGRAYDSKAKLVAGQSVAYLYNTAQNEATRMLPATCPDFPLLMLGLDQGSIGTAGSAGLKTQGSSRRVTFVHHEPGTIPALLTRRPAGKEDTPAPWP